MLFGTQPHLPIDALLGREPEEGTESNWLSFYRERLQDAHARAREYAEKKAAEQTARHESEVYCPEVAVGHQVYLRHCPAGRNKIQDTWAPEVYEVKEVQGTTNVVEPEGGGVQRSTLFEKPSVLSDLECVVVEETWRATRKQSMPLVEGSPEQSNPQVEISIEPEFGVCESVDEPLTTVDRGVDEGIGSVEVVPTDSVPDAVVKHPVPAQRHSLAFPVEPTVQTPVPHQSQRQTAG